MATYYVTLTVDFSGEIEAESEEEAERLAIYDKTVMYDGVNDIQVEELIDYEDEEENE